ncbi:YbhB/YbcL family Raf kinase inhibitor-like protein [Niveibacterium microcysteis]|uniref:YbhB/YbcL family Raf kinase inhibitor-like protein n=1 Tax=Niveibacterium microcysteis TaxID=2811415 RepID=A0ABX7M9A3_9RHOO|nr:YbhB/YbcL family Raf kinase inhibitor-like protein [Niveibacterium microcysteis]QSI77050.1 YbhB/YbcL family Raf kinase inhibitor-like protein [Niveibacterium microcysteis]
MQLRSLALIATLIAMPASAADFTLKSDALASGKLAPAQYANAFGCSGGNVSPDLRWDNAPAGTRSFAVTVYDPDAPTGSGWWHWVVANLPADTSALSAGAGSAAGKLPAAAMQLNTDTGQPGFLGACPPVGETHRYIVTVHALNVDRFDLPAHATPAMLGFMMRSVTLGRASLTATGAR